MALGGAFLSADFPFYLVMRVVTAPVDIWCSSHPDRADERLLAGPGPSWGALAHLPQAASFLAQQEVWVTSLAHTFFLQGALVPLVDRAI